MDSSNTTNRPRKTKTIQQQIEQKKDLLKHDLSFISGFEDEIGFGIDFDDYYTNMGELGFFRNDKLPKNSPLTLSTDTTTALHFYDKSLQKTPIDPRQDVIHADLSKLAKEVKDGDAYNIQDFERLASDNIKQRTLRILSDPEEKYESELLARMKDRKRHILTNFEKIKPLNQLLEYNLMNLNIVTMNLNRQAKSQFLLEKLLYFHEERQKPRGKSFYAEINLTAKAEATRLDFRDEKDNKNVSTASTTFFKNFPQQNLMYLSVYVMSGTKVYLATNESDSSLDTYIPLTTSDGAYVYDGKPYHPIESINIRANDADDCQVKIVGLY